MTAAEPFETGTAMDSKHPPPLSEGSRFYQRLQRRYADVFAGLPQVVPERESLTQAYTQLRTQGLEVGAALRVLRQWTMARLLTLDCEHQASLETVTLGVTHLAAFQQAQCAVQADALSASGDENGRGRGGHGGSRSS